MKARLRQIASLWKYGTVTSFPAIINIVSVWIVVGVTAVLLVINSWFIKGKANPIIRNMTTPVLCYAFFAVAQIVEVSVNA